MNRNILMAVSLMAVSLNVAAETRTFDANGNLIYDSSEPGEKDNKVWSEQTKRSIATVKSLVKQTPEYNDGYYVKLEEDRKRREENARRAIAQAEAAKERFETSLRVRAVEAAEAQAYGLHRIAERPQVVVVH